MVIRRSTSPTILRQFRVEPLRVHGRRPGRPPGSRRAAATGWGGGRPPRPRSPPRRRRARPSVGDTSPVFSPTRTTTGAWRSSRRSRLDRQQPGRLRPALPAQVETENAGAARHLAGVRVPGRGGARGEQDDDGDATGEQCPTTPGGSALTRVVGRGRARRPARRGGGTGRRLPTGGGRSAGAGPGRPRPDSRALLQGPGDGGDRDRRTVVDRGPDRGQFGGRLLVGWQCRPAVLTTVLLAVVTHGHLDQRERWRAPTGPRGKT